jgi:hypothetical protein
MSFEQLLVFSLTTTNKSVMKIFNLVKHILFNLLINLNGNSQSLNTVDILERQNQACLDKGVFMLGCSKVFYIQMDSFIECQV